MVPEASAWIMFGPDSKVVNLRSSPAALVQPSPLATKIGAAPTIGITPTRTEIVCARAGASAKASAKRLKKARAIRREKKRIGVGSCSVRVFLDHADDMKPQAEKRAIALMIAHSEFPRGAQED